MARNIGKIEDFWISVQLNHTLTAEKREKRNGPYDIWLSDPKYFLLTNHPGGTPGIYKTKVKVYSS